MQKGAKLILITALVSGISVFINAFAVKGLNPFLFTTLKNVTVAAMLAPLLIMLKNKPCIVFEKKFMPTFIVIGLIGGSLPFFLYFYALSMIPAATAGFIHKTLFIWATLFAVFLLKEKVSKFFFLACLLFLVGNYFMGQPSGSVGLAEALALAATILWAIENVIARRLLMKEKVTGLQVAFARMFYGSIFMVLGLFLFAPDSLYSSLQGVDGLHWLLLTSLLLVLYVATYYTGLKEIEVHKATSILLLAQPITIVLSFAFGAGIKLSDAIGISSTLLGLFVLFGLSFIITKTKHKVPCCTKVKH